MPSKARAVIVGVVLLLVLTNLLNNAWAPGAHLVVSPLVALLLLAIGRRAGLSWSDLGLGRADVARGLRWGAVVLLVIVVGYGVGLLLPFARDAAAASPGEHSAWFNALVAVPLGTVLLEEVAFRGVLWALIARDSGTRVATGASSALFGIWHVLPALGSSVGIQVPAVLAEGWFGRLVWVLLTVLATAGAGVVFCELRRRSGSLLAPILAHWGLNGVGFGFRALAG